MDSANLVQIAWGFLGGVLACILCYSILSFKLFRLQFAVAGIREGLLSLRNTRANEVRRGKKDELDQFMQSVPAHKNERFANDPPGWG